MERRFAVRYEELMAEAEVKPEALEGVLKRLDEFVNRLLPGREVGLCALLESFQRGLRQFKERLVVALKSVGGQCFEGIRQLLLSFIQQG